MSEPRGTELIQRYISNYGNLPDGNITEEMILRHWELEKELTRRLRESTPENRWEVFDRCYTQLYSELDWLNRQVHPNTINASPVRLYGAMLDLIQPDDKRVYEVGSGKGKLISYLASKGHECKATEITRERGRKHVDEQCPNLTWGTTDGIHLDRFEEEGYWDVVISRQVIEHMHPDDLNEHLRSVHRILAPGGKYIISTPHRYSGPHDISRIFGYDFALGMHLKEYTYAELRRRCRTAGFTSLQSSIRVPKKIANVKPVPSGAYVWYLILLENIFNLVPNTRIKRKLIRLAKIVMFQDDILIVAKKT